jgi:hypothetical protein
MLGKTPRFIRGVKMLDAYDASKHPSARDYALDIVQELGIKRWNKWAILVDVKNMTAYFHTDRNRKLRHVSFDAFDFTRGPAEFLDMHADLSGDLAGEFLGYTYEKNLQHAEERAKHLFIDRFYGLIDNGVTAHVYAKRFADYSARIRSGSDGELGQPE